MTESSGPMLVSVRWDELEGSPSPLVSVIQLSWGTPHLLIWLGFFSPNPPLSFREDAFSLMLFELYLGFLNHF